MIKALTTTIIICLFVNISIAQSPSGIQQAAEKYAQANLDEDFESLAGYTYPVILKKSGGKEAIIHALEVASDLLKIRNMKVESYEIGKIEKFTHCSGETHALVPVTTKIKVPGGEIINHITLIAVSKVSSDQWYFIETSSLEPNTIHNYLPTWNYTLGLKFDESHEFIGLKSE
ncbi:hypothetical protein KZP23_12205 [Echinicola marina]|uniref:hypothetical protein n=1 Tax=Echinicola marina TaxID=2859768 RepID=UPI001CF64285|nr:hypothetical protein [Echinicola marina]UCS91524.1 hypothetical protein KZP23_12205 [Echinicola marina]